MEPLRYVAAIVIGGKGNKITPTGAVVPENTDSRCLSVSVLPTKTFVCCTCWNNNDSSKIANGRFTTRRTAWQE